MKAILVDEQSADRSLVWRDTASPTYGAEEVLVDVHATALNRADLAQRAGNYPPPHGASEILGLEMAGTIAAIGERVRGWAVGDKVCALLSGGGYAEQVAVPAAMLMRVPAGWSMAQAAALPEAFLTAFVNLYLEGGLGRGEVALVHGGASGVGTAAIQLCRTSGNPVVATAGSDEKCAMCTRLGATAINYRTEDWPASVRKLYPGGVDVILDMVGAEYLAANLELLRTKGRLVFIATLGGAKAEIDIRQLMTRRLHLIGSVLRSRTLEEKTAIRNAFLASFGDAIERATIQPVIDSVYPIILANDAHKRMAENRNIGKIVLQVR